MHSIRLCYISVKYQRSTSSGCKDINIKKIEFLARLNSELISCTNFPMGKNVNIISVVTVVTTNRKLQDK